ncbi:MAG TPA: hypothetical protein VNX47_06575 [Nevskia sp.]|jgi:hypothetical protein|nr:hypothetical protein [Nevskia sp.]
MHLDPDDLPDIANLKRRTKALAMLDAIVCPEWEYRYYSYNSRWSFREEMASMRNGQGDEWFLLFDSAGAALKGLDHESPIARNAAFPEEIQRVVPPSFSSFLHEPAFSIDHASFCYWRGVSESAWSRVAHPDPVFANTEDGSETFLALLVTPPLFYQEFALDYYERELPLAAIEHIYANAPLSQELIRTLNPDLGLNDALESASEIAYPDG